MHSGDAGREVEVIGLWELLTHACRLHSRQQRRRIQGELQGTGIISALEHLFTACSQLEYLCICRSFEDEASRCTALGLRLPPRLKFLALYGNSQFTQALLDVEKCRALAPNLRGLQLYQTDGSAPLPNHLSELVNLTYLGVAVTKVNGPSLLPTLAAMPQLKALELRDCNDMTSGVIDDFATHCQQLEHLSLIDVEFRGNATELEVLRQVSMRLVQLRSLFIREFRWDRGSVDWSWLRSVAARGLLEYVHVCIGPRWSPDYRKDCPLIYEPVDWSFPADEIVRNCKVGCKLRGSKKDSRTIQASLFRTSTRYAPLISTAGGWESHSTTQESSMQLGR